MKNAEKKLEKLLAWVIAEERHCWDMMKWCEDNMGKSEAAEWRARWAVYNDMLTLMQDEG